jgi:hypothetical protein
MFRSLVEKSIQWYNTQIIDFMEKTTLKYIMGRRRKVVSVQRNTLGLLGFFVALVISMPMVHAQSLLPPAIGSCDFVNGDLQYQCIPIYIGYVVQFVLGFATGFFLIGIMMGGYKWALFSASQSKQAGREQLKGAFIGFLIVVFAYLLVDTIIEALT